MYARQHDPVNLNSCVLPVAPAVVGEQARFRLFDSVTSFLCRVAQRQPVVVVLDDLHWADEASLRLLRFFVSEIRAAPVFAVATYRDVEVRRGHPLSDLLGALAREPICERRLLCQVRSSSADDSAFRVLTPAQTAVV